MKKDQEKKRSQHGGYGKKYLFLLSWTLTGQGTLYNLNLLSRTANPQLPKELHSIFRAGDYKSLPNIVYLDHLDPYLCDAIIRLNFHR